MFVVRRAFRDSDGVRSVGSIVAPTDVKRFQHRFGMGYIIEVTEQNLDRYTEYFKARYHVDITPKRAKVEKPEEAEEPVKVTVKAVAKTL